MRTTQLLLLRLLLLFALQPFFDKSNHHVLVEAALSCSDDSYCEQMIRPGSYCIIEEQDEDEKSTTTTTTTATTTLKGVCSNPFEQGCLKALLPEKLESSDKDIDDIKRRIQNFHTILEGRICNSDDINDETDQCKNPLFDYPEIRIHGGDWESSIFISWIYQIILMEILETPVTVGSGPSGVGHGSGIVDNTYDTSFYNPYNTMSYSSQTYPWDGLKLASQIGDCNRLSKSVTSNDTTSIEACVHVFPEVWNGQAKDSSNALREGYVDPIEGNGQVGKGGWFIPDYTASSYDNSLVSFYGIRGEENRHKVAAAFKRPLQWKDYCEKISTTNCTVPDATATHYPLSESEQISYFSDSFYTGYFHLSDKNNCTKNPKTCTGAIIAPPCGWTITIDSQLYWNNIVGLEPDGPLEPHGGYSYSQMIQVWRAANATKSNVVMWWWKPEALVEQFFNTSYEFLPFDLPEPSDVCAKARPSTTERCSADINIRRGDSDGACDQEAHPLTKVYATSLRELSLQETNLAYRSPAYQTIRNIKIPYLQIKDLLRRWINVGTDRYGSDPRMAVCSWVVDNLDEILKAVPDGYPRILDTEHSSNHDGYKYAAIVVASITNLLVWIALGATHYYRDTRIMKFSQVYFIQTILVGYGLISIAAIVVVIQPPTDHSCTFTAWLVALGYNIELVPLLVKIAAINKIMQSAKKMRRVQVSQKTMAQIVLGAVLVVIIYLIVWTTIDPLKVIEVHTLTTTTNGGGDTSKLTIDTTPFVLSYFQCDCSFYYTWYYIVICGQGILLLMASVLAFQSRNVRQEFNESRSLATLAYSHFMFLLLRIVVTIVDESFNRTSKIGGGRIYPVTIMASIFSFLYSLDTLAAICIYIVPKALKAAKVSSHSNRSNDGFRNNNSSNSAQQSSAISEIQRKAAKAQEEYSKNKGNSRKVSFFFDGNNNNTSKTNVSFTNSFNNSYSSTNDQMNMNSDIPETNDDEGSGSEEDNYSKEEMNIEISKANDDKEGGTAEDNDDSSGFNTKMVGNGDDSNHVQESIEETDVEEPHEEAVQTDWKPKNVVYEDGNFANKNSLNYLDSSTNSQVDMNSKIPQGNNDEEGGIEEDNFCTKDMKNETSKVNDDEEGGTEEDNYDSNRFNTKMVDDDDDSNHVREIIEETDEEQPHEENKSN